MSSDLRHRLLEGTTGALWLFQIFIHSVIPQLNHPGGEQWPCLHSGCTISKNSESFRIDPAMLGDAGLFSQVIRKVEADIQAQDEPASSKPHCKALLNLVKSSDHKCVTICVKVPVPDK